EIVKARRACLLASVILTCRRPLAIATSSLNFVQDPVHSRAQGECYGRCFQFSASSGLPTSFDVSIPSYPSPELRHPTTFSSS
ncbi:hypothetical protein B0H13DRAFT_1970106, partial [Mycena leptocephala]